MTISTNRKRGWAVILNSKFFSRPAPIVAKELLGKCLVRRWGGKTLHGIITETEAYEGLRDKASHAYRGLTRRNFPMFGPAGRWYVYFIYGNYWMLNIVTGKKGHPSAILIRGAALRSTNSLRNYEQKLNGPGRLTKFFKIDERFNNLPANKKTGLWIEFRPSLRSASWRRSNLTLKIKSSPRIGVSYAGPYWSKRRWRFYL